LFHSSSLTLICSTSGGMLVFQTVRPQAGLWLVQHWLGYLSPFLRQDAFIVKLCPSMAELSGMLLLMPTWAFKSLEACKIRKYIVFKYKLFEVDTLLMRWSTGLSINVCRFIKLYICCMP
jgi:hypothetical protein